MLCQVYLEYSQSKQCNYFGFTLCHGVVRPEVPAPRGLCADLQMSCCAFPGDVEALRGKATLTFLRTAVNFLFLLGLCVASLPECFAWGHPQQTVPVLGWVFVELESPQGWEQPWGSSQLALRRAESCYCPFQGCCFCLMGSLLSKVCPSPQGRLFPSLWGTSFPSSVLCLLHPCGSGMASEAEPTLARLE